MIIDTGFFGDLAYAESLEYYSDLIEYMEKIGCSKEHWEKLNIHADEHHITPLFEETIDTAQDNYSIYLPVLIHFRAHILRAQAAANIAKAYGEVDCKNSMEYIMIGNYTEAYCLMRKYKHKLALNKQLHDNFLEAEAHYQKWFKAKTLEQQYGRKKAAIIRAKISHAMHNLDPDIINNRNASISRYASQRPQSHNNAISKAKRKTVCHIETGKYYSSAKEAAKATGISQSSIKLCCQGKWKSVKNQSFEYII